MFGCKFKEKFILISVSYGNLTVANGYILLGEGEALEEVSLHGFRSEILGLTKILEEKYGPSTKTTEVIQTKLGAKFEKEIFVWADTHGNMITVNSITKDINMGSITIQSASRLAKKLNEEKANIEKFKSKL